MAYWKNGVCKKKLSDALFGELVLEEFNEILQEKFYTSPSKYSFETEKSFLKLRRDSA